MRNKFHERTIAFVYAREHSTRLGLAVARTGLNKTTIYRREKVGIPLDDPPRHTAKAREKQRASSTKIRAEKVEEGKAIAAEIDARKAAIKLSQEVDPNNEEGEL